MGKDASTIRQEIEATRERMGDAVEALAYKTDVPARMKDTVNDRVDALKGTLGNAMDNVKTAVAGASDSVKVTVSEASGSLGDAVDAGTRGGAATLAQTRDRVGATVNDVSSAFGERLQNADVGANARRVVGAVQENPVGLAIAALAVGFLTGSLIPVSEAERRRVGPLRDKLIDGAQATAGDLVQAGKAVALETLGNAASTAKSSAQAHGQDVVDAAKNRAAGS